MHKDAALLWGYGISGSHCLWRRQCLRNRHRNVNSRMAPEPHAADLDFESVRRVRRIGKSRGVHSVSIDVECTSPAAVAAERSACHCRWSHESLAD